jgi:hypothetical protein
MLRNVVRDENPHTELLYNMLQLDGFRQAVLTRLFSKECALHTSHLDARTQANLHRCGCADLLIENSDVCAILEVKVNDRRGLTENQPEGYLQFLVQQPQRERRLTFLIPKRWAYRKECSSRLKALAKPGIESAIVEWEEIIEVLESTELRNANPILTEFTNLLIDRYKTRPVNFSTVEVDVLFSMETAAAVSKLYEPIEKIRKKSDIYNQSGQRSDPHGIYFNNHKGEESFLDRQLAPVLDEVRQPARIRSKQRGSTKRAKGFYGIVSRKNSRL